MDATGFCGILGLARGGDLAVQVDREAQTGSLASAMDHGSPARQGRQFLRMVNEVSG